MPVSAQQSFYRPLYRRISRRFGLRRRVIYVPSAKLEYAYYFAVLYSVMAPAVGLEVPLLAGLLICAVWLFCLFRVQSSIKEIFAPILWLIACAASFLIIQVFVHGESPLDSDLRAFITWIMALMILQSLLLRPGFMLRFPVFLFAIGAMTLPFLGFNRAEVDMARVDLAVQGGLTHPAGFAHWFGFCAIFFAVFGVESRKPAFKIGAWGLMLLCALLVALSVERGPLFATALGLLFAFRSALKRGFLPLLVLIVFAGVISFTGVFERAVSNYDERGFEDTGREILWPEATERIEAAPLFGVGKSDALIQLAAHKFSPPHNSVLYLALTSGVVPALLFAGFWLQVIWKTVFRSPAHGRNPFCLPYLAFILPSLMLVDTAFMAMGALLITAFLASAIKIGSPQVLTETASARNHLSQRHAYAYRPMSAAKTSRGTFYGINPHPRARK